MSIKTHFIDICETIKDISGKDDMSWIPEKPFNDLPSLPPSVELIETKEILKLCTRARVALESLRQAVELIPNQSMLIYTIPILEAKTSSEIENIVTTTDELFKFLDKPHSADPATKEALRYRTALFSGLESIKACPLSVRTSKIVCSSLRGTEVDIRKLPGTYIGNSATGKIVYTPPEGEVVIREKLANWENFVNEETELDPLIVMALMHYQFEAIHPFNDGNGRTGRVLNILYLVQANLLDLPILYLSRYIIKNKTEYYECLLNVTKEQDWMSWVKFMLSAVADTAEWTKNKVLEIRNLEFKTIELMKSSSELKKLYSRELVDLIFSLPYIRIQNLVEANIVKRQSASKYLKMLTEHGILVEQSASREKLFVNRKLLDLLKED